MVAVLDHYGYREPRWGESLILCPVHAEDRPSCSVNRGKGLFHCHACGASGSAIDIVMTRESLEFGDALRFIEGLGVSTAPTPQPVRRPGRSTGKRWVPPRLREAG